MKEEILSSERFQTNIAAPAIKFNLNCQESKKLFENKFGIGLTRDRACSSEDTREENL